MHQSIFDKLPFGGYVLFSPGTHRLLLRKYLTNVALCLQSKEIEIHFSANGNKY
jgi:hypothetical protein